MLVWLCRGLVLVFERKESCTTPGQSTLNLGAWGMLHVLGASGHRHIRWCRIVSAHRLANVPTDDTAHSSTPATATCRERMLTRSSRSVHSQQALHKTSQASLLSEVGAPPLNFTENGWPVADNGGNSGLLSRPFADPHQTLIRPYIRPYSRPYALLHLGPALDF